MDFLRGPVQPPLSALAGRREEKEEEEKKGFGFLAQVTWHKDDRCAALLGSSGPGPGWKQECRGRAVRGRGAT